MEKALIVTSISSPNECLSNLAEQAKHNKYSFLCMGDKKSPENFHLDHCDFYGVRQQEQLTYSLAGLLPWNHYCRKNLGYLIAIDNGCEYILETDDDNFPETDDFWQTYDSAATYRQVEGDGWLNIYSYYGVDSWPRGFPLEKIRNLDKFFEKQSDTKAYIVQRLVNGDPDVDAIFRLTRSLDITFGQYEPVVLGTNVWCPFNSQNTFWCKPAFPLLYLPVTCSFRATDIIRSYVAQPCLWAMGSNLAFTGANAKQIRNEHDLLRDFHDETVIYLEAENIRRQIGELDLNHGHDINVILENMLNCYKQLVKMKVVTEQELITLDAWLKDISDFY